MRAILMKAAQSKYGWKKLEWMGSSGRRKSSATKRINWKNSAERNYSIETCKSLNEEMFWQMTDVNRGIWSRILLEWEMTIGRCRMLKSLTENKPINNTRIINDNGRDCKIQRQMANACINMYMSVRSLKDVKWYQGWCVSLTERFW